MGKITSTTHSSDIDFVGSSTETLISEVTAMSAGTQAYCMRIQSVIFQANWRHDILDASYSKANNVQRITWKSLHWFVQFLGCVAFPFRMSRQGSRRGRTGKEKREDREGGKLATACLARLGIAKSL